MPGLIQQALQQQPETQAPPTEQPIQESPQIEAQAPDLSTQVITEITQIFEAGKDAMLQRFGDGEGDVIDEIGETSAQIARSSIKTLANAGVKLVPPQQMEILPVIVAMLIELCTDNGILKTATQKQDRALAVAATIKYFKRFNQQEAKGQEPKPPTPQTAPPQAAPAPQGAMQ